MTIRDRLYEMQQLSGMEEGRSHRSDESKTTADASLQHFLTKVDEIRHVLMTLSMDREAIRREQEDCLAAGCADTARNRQLNAHVDQFIRQARVLRVRLKEASDDLQKYPESGYGTGRARHEQVRSLIASFETIMTQFSEDQIQYKSRAGKKVAAYLRMQNIEVSDEQIDEVIENGGSISQLTRYINLGVAQKKALFDDVKNRATDIMIVERQIREVEELFIDLQMLVQQQGETIDRIETSVINAAEYAGRAEKNVKEAVELRRKNRKWKIVTCIALIILVLVLLAIFRIFSPI